MTVLVHQQDSDAYHIASFVKVYFMEDNTIISAIFLIPEINLTESLLP